MRRCLLVGGLAARTSLLGLRERAVVLSDLHVAVPDIELGRTARELQVFVRTVPIGARRRPMTQLQPCSVPRRRPAVGIQLLRALPLRERAEMFQCCRLPLDTSREASSREMSQVSDGRRDFAGAQRCCRIRRNFRDSARSATTATARRSSTALRAQTRDSP